jgi:hypothetical protein
VKKGWWRWQKGGGKKEGAGELEGVGRGCRGRARDGAVDDGVTEREAYAEGATRGSLPPQYTRAVAVVKGRWRKGGGGAEDT